MQVLTRGDYRARDHKATGVALAACGWLLLAALPAQAQVQRSFVNPSFEIPYIGTNVRPAGGCHRTVPADWLPGWSSTEANSNPAGFSSGCTYGSWTGTLPQTALPAANSNASNRNMIQQFRETLGGVNAVQGSQWAELNADSNARLYQSVCMAPGERVDWSLSHRARANTVNPEVMEFNISASANGAGATLIVRAAEITSGAQGTLITPANHRRECGAIGTCTLPADDNATTPTGWVNYSGSFVWGAAATQNQTIGFQAIYGQGGAANAGNFLDNIVLTLKPFLDFGGSSVTYTEGGTQPVVPLRIVGVVPSSFSVTLAASGTATATSDYTLTTATISIPAGDYGAGQIFNAPLTFIDDTEMEGTEDLVLTIPASNPSSPYVLANTSACGDAVRNQITATILDNDTDLSITKTNTPASGPSDQASDTVISGANTTYSLVITNHNTFNPVTGAVVRDIPDASLTCPGAGNPANATCTGSGCASATYPIAGLTSAAGITLGTLGTAAPANSVTLTMTCRVN